MIHLSGSDFGSDSLTLLVMTNNEELTNNDAWTKNTLTNMTWHASWISGFLHFCFSAQLWLWLLFLDSALFFFIRNQLLNNGENITVNVAVLLENLWFSNLNSVTDPFFSTSADKNELQSGSSVTAHAIWCNCSSQH